MRRGNILLADREDPDEGLRDASPHEFVAASMCSDGDFLVFTDKRSVYLLSSTLQLLHSIDRIGDECGWTFMGFFSQQFDRLALVEPLPQFGAFAVASQGYSQVQLVRVMKSEEKDCYRLEPEETFPIEAHESPIVSLSSVFLSRCGLDRTVLFVLYQDGLLESYEIIDRSGEAYRISAILI